MAEIINKPEIVIGLVSPIGVDLVTIVSDLKDYLKHFNYEGQLIQLSSLIRNIEGLEIELHEEPEYKRIDSYMTAGDDARKKSGRGDILAALSINQINKSRQNNEPLNGTAHILRSLKHPDEVGLLREIYEDGFYLLGIFSSWTQRKAFFERKNIPQTEAKYLIDRDESEEFDWGQQTRDAFHLADVFIDADREDIATQISRFLDVIFGYPYYTPTKDEYAMFLAFSASLRSADLSRQVGAVITSREGEIVATGANDVPCFNGGLYWSDHQKDNRDYIKGYDSNALHKDDMLLEIMKKIDDGGMDEDELLKAAKIKFKNAKLLDITEYGRIVHAEMEALLCCSRIGLSPTKGTLYCTTFPCHNCAKHIIAAGINRVVFVEPYPKSQAKTLHGDEIVIKHEEEDLKTEEKVMFEPFVGFGPRKFLDLFSMNLSKGYTLQRKESGKIINWQRENAAIRIPLLPLNYIDREETALREINIQIEGGDYENQEKSE